jgi:hypothetical protein
MVEKMKQSVTNVDNMDSSSSHGPQQLLPFPPPHLLSSAMPPIPSFPPSALLPTAAWSVHLSRLIEVSVNAFGGVVFYCSVT